MAHSSKHEEQGIYQAAGFILSHPQIGKFDMRGPCLPMGVINPPRTFKLSMLPYMHNFLYQKLSSVHLQNLVIVFLFVPSVSCTMLIGALSVQICVLSVPVLFNLKIPCAIFKLSGLVSHSSAFSI